MTLPEISRLLDEAGACRWGTADALPPPPPTIKQYADWIASGKHGTMDYLDRYHDVRSDPRLLLPGARSIIVAAFNYYHPEVPRLPIARYALGRDYHEVVRRRLMAVADSITAGTGETCRVTVDTAPLRERYFAVCAGVGFVGKNNLLIVPGIGSWVVLGEIITTLSLPPSEPCVLNCADCGKCAEACPGGALDGSGTAADARRCLSYLTIEYRGATLPSDRIPSLYGCDVCQAVCPHNATAPVTTIPEFMPRSELLILSAEQVATLSQPEFSRIFSHSAIKRAKLAGLLRNLHYLDRRQ